MKERISKKLESLGKKHNWLFILLPVVLLGVFFFFITLNNVQTEIYDIERFSNASETIRSPITIENEQETERKTRRPFNLCKIDIAYPMKLRWSK